MADLIHRTEAPRKPITSEGGACIDMSEAAARHMLHRVTQIDEDASRVQDALIGDRAPTEFDWAKAGRIAALVVVLVFTLIVAARMP